jgi:hypothetical protein
MLYMISVFMTLLNKYNFNIVKDRNYVAITITMMMMNAKEC